MNYRFVNGKKQLQKVAKITVCLVWWCLAGYAQTSANTFNPTSSQVLWLGGWQFAAGDSLHWANPTHNYRDWRGMRLRRRLIANVHQGNFWLKTSVRLTHTPKQQTYVLQHYVMNSATEVFWDGISIAKNGVVGHNKASEVLGDYTVQVTIPPKLLTKGRHVLAVRVSNFHYPNRTLFGRPNLGSALAMQQKHYRWVLEHTLVTTVLVMIIIFCVWLFFGLAKNASLLFFVGFCVVQILELLLNFYGMYEKIDLGIYNVLLTLLDIIDTCDSFFLAAYLVYEFHIGDKKYWLGGAFLVSTITSYWGFYHLSIGWVLALVLVVKAIAQKEKTAWVVLAGILIWMLCTYLMYEHQFEWWSYFVGIVFLIMSMILASLMQIHQRLRQQHRMELRTARLENQLLKKNIQPHFLMNSLVSLQQLIHESPAKAEEMIDELAVEFHMFSKVAEKRLIAMRDELKICRAHLRIMEFRKDATFTLETIGVTGEELIPPAVFHTLIENGITHGYGKKNQGKFVLEKQLEPKQVVYRLFNDGEVEPASQEPTVVGSGTGFKYVEARLQEAYGTHWSWTHGQVANGWEVRLSLPIL
jgi:hypothetical protein